MAVRNFVSTQIAPTLVALGDTTAGTFSIENNSSIVTESAMDAKPGTSLFPVAAVNGSNTTANGTMSIPMYLLAWVSVANILVFLVGVLGNTLVILVVLRVREMKTPTNLYLMNLAFADLLVLMICLPMSMLEFYTENNWVLGRVMCKMMFFLENVVTLSSILIIVTVSLERFWAVYYPIKSYSSGSKTRVMISVLVIWIIAACGNAPILILARTFRFNSKLQCTLPTTKTWHFAYFGTYFALVFVVPFALLTVLYAMIIRKVITETMECKQMTDKAKVQAQQNRKQLVIMLLSIIVLFFVCLLPFRILALVAVFSTKLEIDPEPFTNMLHIVRLLTYINSAGNPIIYNIVSTKFRRAFQRVLRNYCACCRCCLSKLGGSRSINDRTSASKMTMMSHYSVVKTDVNEMSETADAV